MSGVIRALVLATTLISAAAQAATIVIVNNDGPGEGLNDPGQPPNANQVGNNPGANLGEMRMNVLQAVADRWGALLNSAVTITVNAEFNPLFCMGNSAVLGQAGTTGSVANFGGGDPNVAYHAALAESLAGVNLNGGNAEINAQFNSTVDSDPACLGGDGFYYGTDGNAPEGTARLYPTALHEFAHGLGFGPLVNLAGDGSWTGDDDVPDAYSRNLFDLEIGESWDTMSNNERLTSSTNAPDLIWAGAQVTSDRSDWLDPAPEVEINSPPGIAGTHDANLGAEPTIVMPPAGLTANVVDGDALMADPCAFENIPAMSGTIVLFEEPAGCTAAFPAFFAETNGAVGAIMSSPDPAGLPDMSGEISNQDITIPYVGVEMSVGDDLRANIGTPPNVTIRNSPTVLQGDNMGMLKMHAPAMFSQGSSAAHWTSDAEPDLLMEAALGDLEHNQVDLTLSAFFDMGWSVNLSEIIFEDGFEDP